MALRSCLFGALLILSVLSTQSLAARRLDEAFAPLADPEPDKNVYPKPPDPPVPSVGPKKADYTAAVGTNELPKTKKINESQKTEVQGKAAVRPNDCIDDCGVCEGDDCEGDDRGIGGGEGDGGDFVPPDCGRFWHGGDDTGGGEGEGEVGDFVPPECGRIWHGGDGGGDRGNDGEDGGHPGGGFGGAGSIGGGGGGGGGGRT